MFSAMRMSMKFLQTIFSKFSKPEHISKDTTNDKSLVAVARETDEEKWKEIAINAPNYAEREAAVNNITDQSFLFDIAQKDKNDFVRKAAVRMLTDQSALALIAKTEMEITICEIAVGKLGEATLLVDVAEHAFDYHRNGNECKTLCCAAMRKLTDQNDRADIAHNATSFDVRRIAIGYISDLNLLAVFLKKLDTTVGTSTDALGKFALEKLTDQELLADIVKNALDANIRANAVGKLTDQSLLVEIAINDTDGSLVAVKALSNKELLAHVVTQAKNPDIKEIALQRLGGYICPSCSHEIWPRENLPAPCVCTQCQAENHDFRRCSRITEYRDYECGTRWEECTRCGIKKNAENVNTM